MWGLRSTDPEAQDGRPGGLGGCGHQKSSEVQAQCRPTWSPKGNPGSCLRSPTGLLLPLLSPERPRPAAPGVLVLVLSKLPWSLHLGRKGLRMVEAGGGLVIILSVPLVWRTRLEPHVGTGSPPSQWAQPGLLLLIAGWTPGLSPPAPSHGPGCLFSLLVPVSPPSCLSVLPSRLPGAQFSLLPVASGCLATVYLGLLASPVSVVSPVILADCATHCSLLYSFVSELHPFLNLPLLQSPDPTPPGALPRFPRLPPSPSPQGPDPHTDRSLWGVKLRISSGKILNFACVLSPLGCVNSNSPQMELFSALRSHGEGARAGLEVECWGPQQAWGSGVEADT